MRHPVLAIGATLAFAAFAGATAAHEAMPNPVLTPGAIASTNVTEICARDGRPGSSYSRTHRVWHDKAMTLERYGLPPSAARDVEDDDRVPVCVGGDNASALNHWPQPLAEARVKDRFEARVCRAVCAGRLDLHTAQQWFLDDWTLHYGEMP